MSQLQIATEGRIGFLRQTAFDNPQAVDANFDYFPYTSCDYGPVQGFASLPLEAGAGALPRGLYKTGLVFAGNVTMIPRMEERFGWLMEAAIGDASTWPDQTIAQVVAGAGANIGVNTHQFLFQSESLGAQYNEFDIPYLSVHRLLPNRTAASEVAEISQDAVITFLQIAAAPAGIATATIGLVGRGTGTTVMDVNPGYTTPGFDDDDTFLSTSCAGSVSLLVTGGTPATSTEFDTGAVTITLTNAVLPPAQSRKIGSAHPIDFPNLGRTLTIDTTLWVADYDAYLQTFGGPASPVVDTDWSCIPLLGDVDIVLQSQEEIAAAATTAYHMMRFRTTQGNVRFSARPIVLAPGQPVLFALRGQVCEAASGIDFEWYIQNAFADYD